MEVPRLLFQGLSEVPRLAQEVPVDDPQECVHQPVEGNEDELPEFVE